MWTLIEENFRDFFPSPLKWWTGSGHELAFLYISRLTFNHLVLWNELEVFVLYFKLSLCFCLLLTNGLLKYCFWSTICIYVSQGLSTVCRLGIIYIWLIIDGFFSLLPQILFCMRTAAYSLVMTKESIS